MLLKSILKFFQNNKKWIKILFSSILLLYVFIRIDFNSFLSQISQINTIWFFLALVVLVLNIFISAYKWWKILKFENINFSLLKIIKIYWIGFFFNQFLPGRIGGDVIKMSLLLGKTPEKQDYKATFSVFIDRLFNLVGILILAFIGILTYSGNLSHVKYYVPLFFIGLLVVFALIYYAPKIINLVLNRWKSNFLIKLQKGFVLIKEFYNKPYKVFFLIMTATMFQILVVFFNFLLGKSLNINVDFNYYLYFIPLLAIITLLPISFGGFGVREYSYIFFLEKVNVYDEKSLSLSLIVYFSITLISLPGYIFYNYEKK